MGGVLDDITVNFVTITETHDLAPMLESGALASVRGLGPATLAVLRDLVETGESRYLEQLRESFVTGIGLPPARAIRNT